jgi:hypothetical protein
VTTSGLWTHGIGNTKEDIMKGTVTMSLLALALSAFMEPGALAQTASADEAALRTTQQALDAETTGQSTKSHAEALAKQFKVEPQVVESLRTSKQGWGEIGIRLALAQELMKADAQTYPTMADALARVGDLRAEGRGWGAIAKDLGVKLGPIVRETNRVRHELRAENRARGAGTHKPDNAVHNGDEDPSNRLQKAERTEHQSHPERPERPQRPERVERPEKPEKPGR